jgi:hypothetical protein
MTNRNTENFSLANQVWTPRKKMDIIKGYSISVELKQKLFAFLDIQLEFVLQVPHFKFVSSRLDLAGSRAVSDHTKS